MTSDQFAAFVRIVFSARGSLGNSAAAQAFSVSERTMQKWCAGEARIPEGVLRDAQETLTEFLMSSTNPAAQVVRLALDIDQE